MDLYQIDTIKIEKEKAMRRYRTFRKIATIVRTLEFFVAIMFISWSSSYFPAAVKLSGAFLRGVSSFLFSPHFVFVISNAIVITLFAKSGNQAAPISSIDSGDILSGEVPVDLRQSETENVVVVDAPTELAVVPVKEESKSEVKTYQRTQSAVEMVEEKKELRRSKTEPRRKTANGELTAAVEARRRRRMSDVDDDMDNEEFRRKVEAFIEKQQRFLREERKAVVVRNV